MHAGQLQVMGGRLLVSVLAIGFLLLTPARSHAACTISTTGVAFGSYNVFNVTPVSSTGSIVYRCGPHEAASGTITVTISTGQSGTYAPRTMTKGSEALAYNLYLDAARTLVWGNGTNGTQFYTRTQPPRNTEVTLIVYASLPAGQDVSSGSYTDTVSATINF